MRKLVNKLLLNRPRPLPTGMSDFEAWANRIIEQSGRFADEDSMKFALASILIHADAKHGALPDKYFTDRLRKSAANQIASQVFQDVKAKQAEAQAKANQPAEATAPKKDADASDENTPPQQ